MRIDRVADFDYNDPNHILVKHFIDTGTDINFYVDIECFYPPEEFEKVYNYEKMIELKKLEPNKPKVVDIVVYYEREGFERDLHNWMIESDHVYRWSNIKFDKIFLYAITVISKRMIKEIFE